MCNVYIDIHVIIGTYQYCNKNSKSARQGYEKHSRKGRKYQLWTGMLSRTGKCPVWY